MKKYQIECEVNRSIELGVESNIPPKKEMGTKDTHLLWKDDEVQLLLETRDFKAKKAYEIKHKYENIHYRYSESFCCFSITIFFANILELRMSLLAPRQI